MRFHDPPNASGETEVTAGDSCYYPDSGKWAVRKEGDETVILKGAETHYFDGEG